jgi:hypothetical protein
VDFKHQMSRSFALLWLKKRYLRVGFTREMLGGHAGDLDEQNVAEQP